MFWKLSCLVLTITIGSYPECGGGHYITRRAARKTSSIGGSAVLECEVPFPSGQWTEHIISWRKQSIEVPVFIQFNGLPAHIDVGYEGRIHLLEQASIELTDIRGEDEGWYECKVTFLGDKEGPESNGTWVYLAVNSPPVLGEVSPSFLMQNQDDTLDIFCEATANPEPTLTWLKNHKELQETDRITISGNRVQIRMLKADDGGMYTCNFKNNVGQVSHVMKLVINGGVISEPGGNVYIMVPPKNTTENEGSRAKLQCQAEGYPNNITYHWFKGRQSVQEIHGFMARAGIYADGSLVISSVIKEDTGWYSCRPSNGLGPPPEASAYLNITYLPKVLAMPVSLYLPKGMLGRIECPILANPPVTQVAWSKNEQPIDFLHSSRLKRTNQGLLIIKTVMASDEGRYTCTPCSPQGCGSPSNVVKVMVRDPPFFTVRPKAIYQRQPTQTVSMPCLAQGDPKPTIAWRKADGTFPSATKSLQDGGNLTIINLGKEDHGTYECVAKNLVTSVVTTALLIIELTTPHAPYNVTVHTSQTTAKISWLPGFDGGYQQHYVLWYKMDRVGTNEVWRTMRVIPEETNSFTLYNLHRDTSYQFTVLSRNQLGDGYFSDIISSRTKGFDSSNDDTNTGGYPYPPEKPQGRGRGPGAGPSPPYNLSVAPGATGDEDSSLALVIAWRKPTYSEVPITSYVIQYRTVGPWVPLATGISSSSTSYKWTAASHGVTYHFRMFSYYNSTHSNASTAVSYKGIDPLAEGGSITEGMIGGIVGGLLFLLVTVILAIVAVKIFNKRKQREKAMRYGNVKYFGPKQVEANKNSLRITEGLGAIQMEQAEAVL